MEPVTIVTTIMGILMPYVTKGAKALATGVAKEACEKAQGLLDTLKQKLAGNQTDVDNLTSFEEDPKTYGPVVEKTLNKKVAEDPKLAAELSKLLEEMGPVISIFQEWREAETAIGAKVEDVAGGRISVSQKGDRVKNLTGVEAGNIGITKRPDPS